MWPRYKGPMVVWAFSSLTMLLPGVEEIKPSLVQVDHISQEGIEGGGDGHEISRAGW